METSSGFKSRRTAAFYAIVLRIALSANLRCVYASNSCLVRSPSGGVDIVPTRAAPRNQPTMQLVPATGPTTIIARLAAQPEFANVIFFIAFGEPMEDTDGNQRPLYELYSSADSDQSLTHAYPSATTACRVYYRGAFIQVTVHMGDKEITNAILLLITKRVRCKQDVCCFACRNATSGCMVSCVCCNMSYCKACVNSMLNRKKFFVCQNKTCQNVLIGQQQLVPAQDTGKHRLPSSASPEDLA